jgi:inhibitor of cysteine peptidase
MATRVSKRKHFELYGQAMDLRLAIGLLSVFSLLVAIYLVASCGQLLSSIAVSIESPAATVSRGIEEVATTQDPGIIKFESQDDFKSYIDDGKRLYGDGIFETATLTPLAQAGKQALSAAVAAAKGSKAAVTPVLPMDPQIARKYLSLGSNFDPTVPDIAQIGKTNIYFSPDNQYYAGSSGQGVDPGETGGQTFVISAFPAETMVQSETIPADGNVLLTDGSLVVFLGNSLVAYNSEAAFGRQEIWRDRINDGSEIIGAKLVGGKLYLAVKSTIDDANPCPIKPISAGDEAYMVKCSDIYHSWEAMLADSVITAVQISTTTGKVEGGLSFVAEAAETTVVFATDGVYALWGEGGDYITFFSDFLNEKCKGLLPNYIIEKAAKLGGYNISLLAKEMELRSIMMNWLATLNADEQNRIIGEIKARMADYLGGSYHAFEQTRVARIDADQFKFTESMVVGGLIPDGSFADVRDGYLRIVTVSGSGVVKKMNWLVSGQTASEIADEAVNNVYVLDGGLKTAGAAERLNIDGSICALRYAKDIAYASTCAGDQLQVINLSLAENIGLAASLAIGSSDFYVYPFRNRELLVIAKSKRNIKMTILDNTLATKPEKKSEYVLNDYWADFDSNNRAFAADDENKLFFVPTGKGGYVFFHNNGSIELQKGIGTMVPSRAYLKGGMIYIMSNSGVEVFGAPEWAQTGKLVFKQ